MTHSDNRSQANPLESSQMRREVTDWICSSQGQEALSRFAASTPPTAKEIQRSRSAFGPERGQAMVNQFALRSEIQSKLGRIQKSFYSWLGTSKGIQQATDYVIAEYKSSRFPQDVSVIDVCCGIGGDSIALARRGPVIAIDADPMICRFAAHNLFVAGIPSAAVVCQRAELLAIPNSIPVWIHADPDRRHGDVRFSNADFYSPSSDVISILLKQCSGGAIKLAPAADMPIDWPVPNEREWVSRGGQCRQQIAWYFPETSSERIRRATLVSKHSAFESICAMEKEVVAARGKASPEPKAYLYDFDPAVRAAGMSLWLAKHLAIETLGGPSGFFTSEQPPDPQLKQEFASRLVSMFEVFWRGSFDLHQIREELHARSCTTLEIKIRGVKMGGKPVMPETLRSQLLPKKKGRNSSTAAISRPAPEQLTLLLGILDSGRPFSVIARRIEAHARVS